MSSSDLDVLKEIPGYKAILKSVLKCQIQLLIEQLSDQTGEESIILTASVHDGTLSHLGSSTGKGFLEGRDEMKSQFLGYCLKTHHKKKTLETKSPPYQRSNQHQRHAPYRTPQKRIHPVAMQRAGDEPSAGPSHLDSETVGNNFVKQEDELQNPPEPNFTSTPASFPSSLQLSHTQTSGDLDKSGQGQVEGQLETGDSVSRDSDGTNDSSAANIKIEPMTENEMDLEITGVEPGNPPVSQDEWGQGQMGYGTSGAEGDSPLNQGADGSGYMTMRDGPLFTETPGRKIFPRTKRNTLTLNEKLLVLTMAESKSSRQIARELGVGKTQIQNILIKKAQVLDDVSNNVPGHVKYSRRRTVNGDINQLVLQWYKNAAALNFNVTGSHLQAQALRFARSAGIDSFKASNGWLNNFTNRNSIVLRPREKTFGRPDIPRPLPAMETVESKQDIKFSQDVKFSEVAEPPSVNVEPDTECFSSAKVKQEVVEPESETFTPMFGHQTASSEITPMYKHETASSEKTSMFEHQTASSETTPMYKHQTASSEITPMYKHQTASSETTSLFGHQTASSEKTPMYKHQTASSEITPMFKHQTASSEKTPMYKHQTASSETTPMFEHQTTSREQDTETEEAQESVFDALIKQGYEHF